MNPIFMERGKASWKLREERFKKGLVKGVPWKIPKMEKIFQTILSLREIA